MRYLGMSMVDIESETRWNAVAGTEVCQRWWRSMCELMPSNPDCSPLSEELKDVLFLP